MKLKYNIFALMFVVLIGCNREKKIDQNKLELGLKRIDSLIGTLPHVQKDSIPYFSCWNYYYYPYSKFNLRDAINFPLAVDTINYRFFRLSFDSSLVSFFNTTSRTPLFLVNNSPIEIKFKIICRNAVDYDVFIYAKSVEIYSSDIWSDSGKIVPFTPITSTIFYRPFKLLFNNFSSLLNFRSVYFKDSCIIANPAPITLNSIDGKDKYFLRCAFENCIFNRGTMFNLSYEENNVYGRTCRFKDNLYFSNCIIHGTLDLHNCEFDSISTIVLKETPLPDTINLSYLKLSLPVDLRGIQLAKGKNICYINMIGVDFEKVLMQYDNFHLFFPDSILIEKEHRDIVCGTYEGLLAVFKKRGLDESFEKLDCEFRQWQWEYGKDRWQFFSWFWWRYGYAKSRVLLWSFILLCAFSIINSFYFNQLMSVYELKKFAIPKGTGWVIRFYHSLLFTGSIFFKLNLDYEKINFSKGKGWFILIAVEFTLGLLCVGYIASWILGKVG